MLKDIFYFFLDPPSPGVPGGSGLLFRSGNRRFWADPGPVPGGSISLVLILAPSAARNQASVSPPCGPVLRLATAQVTNESDCDFDFDGDVAAVLCS